MEKGKSTWQNFEDLLIEYLSTFTLDFKGSKIKDG